MVSFKDVIRQLIRDVKAEKLRTFLTVFGITWGTVAISLMLAFGTGLHERLRVTEEDIGAIRSEVSGLRAISGEYMTNMRLDYGTKTMSIDVSGVNAEFGSMRNLIPESGGRFVNPIDVDQQRRMVFLGDQLKTNIFGESDAIGKIVLLNQSPFQVIGVLKKKEQDSSYSGRDNEKAFIPASTYRALTGAKYVANIVFQAEGTEQTKPLIERMRGAFAKRLRFAKDDKEALSIWDTTEQFQFFDVFMLAFNSFLGIIGLLTLVVGGIGVSNIMNVVVEERTREIGIKMALGAKQSYILTQFLLETLIVTAIGGLIGFAISIGVCSIFPASLDEYVGKPVVSPLVAFLTTVALGVVGVVAGYFPAREAARLDPVVAMKL